MRFCATRRAGGHGGWRSAASSALRLVLGATVVCLCSAGVAEAQEPAPTPASGMGTVVLVHGLVDVAADVYLDGAPTPALSALAFRRMTDPLALPAGVHTAELRPAGAPPVAPPALSGVFQVVADQRVTVVALVDPKGAPDWLVFPDDARRDDPARGQLRFRHLAASAPVALEVDDRPAAALVTNLTVGGPAAPVPLDPGPHRLRVLDAASGQPVLADRQLQVAAGELIDVYLTGATTSLELREERAVAPDRAALGPAPSLVPSGDSGLVGSAGRAGAHDPSTAPPGPRPWEPSRTLLGFALRSLARFAPVAGAPSDAASAAAAPSVGAGSAAEPGAALASVVSSPWAASLPAGAMALPAQRAVPQRVRIPALGIDAPIEAVGVLPDGHLALPSDVVQVGWFAGGPVPGESGSSVLAAHVDFQGLPGVFFSLGSVAPGTLVSIDRSDGTVATFRTVGAPVSYAKSQLPVEDVFRRGGSGPQLTLITCGGEFDARTRSYHDNVVVLATPVGPPS